MHSPTILRESAFSEAGSEAEYCFTVPNTRPRFNVSKKRLRQLLLAGLLLLIVRHLPPDRTGCPYFFDSSFCHTFTRDQNCIGSTDRLAGGPQSRLAGNCAPVMISSGPSHPALLALLHAEASTHSVAEPASKTLLLQVGPHKPKTTVAGDPVLTTETGDLATIDYAGTEQHLPVLPRESTPTVLDPSRSETPQQTVFYLAVPEDGTPQPQPRPEARSDPQRNPLLLLVNPTPQEKSDSGASLHRMGGTRDMPLADPQQQSALTGLNEDGNLEFRYGNAYPQQQLLRLQSSPHVVLIGKGGDSKFIDEQLSQKHGKQHPTASEGELTVDSDWDPSSEGDEWRSRKYAGLGMFGRQREPSNRFRRYIISNGRGTSGRFHQRKSGMDDAAARRRRRISTYERREKSFPCSGHCKRLQEDIALSSDGIATPGAGRRDLTVPQGATVFTETAIGGEDQEEGEEAALEALLEKRLLRRLIERLGAPPISPPSPPPYGSLYQPTSSRPPGHPSYPPPLHPSYTTPTETYAVPAALLRLLIQSLSGDTISPVTATPTNRSRRMHRVRSPSRNPPEGTQEPGNILLPEDIVANFMHIQAKGTPRNVRAEQIPQKQKVIIYRLPRGEGKAARARRSPRVILKHKTGFAEAFLHVAVAVLILATAHAIIYSSPQIRALTQKLKHQVEQKYAELKKRQPEAALPALPEGNDKDQAFRSFVHTSVPVAATVAVIIGLSVLLHAQRNASSGFSFKNSSTFGN